jgi:hypothetical protein
MPAFTNAKIGSWVCFVAVASACATRPAAQPAVVDVAATVAYLDPGQSRATFAGCLAERKGQRSRGVPAPSASQADDVLVHVVPGGVVVTNILTHPCCLEGNVVFSTRGRVATLHELLSGEPCRCECQSTIDTAVGLDVGLWTVKVEVEQPFQGTQVIAEKRIKVLEPRAELPH